MSRNLVRLTCDSRIQFLDKMPFCMKATKSKGIFQISKSSEDMPTCNFSGKKKITPGCIHLTEKIYQNKESKNEKVVT